MKKDDVKIKVTLGDILNAPWISSWDYICEKYHINEWCLNEGLAEYGDEIKISLSDAERIGVITHDDE